MTPEPKRPLKVFLCHAHADREAVRGLYTRLTKDGVDAWLDKEKLLPGQDWELEIRKAVREADVVVVCLSKQFNQAGFRQKEVRLALDTAMEKPEGEIFIIPARLEECEEFESLRKWHWVDLFENDGYEMLMRALRARADKIGLKLRLQRKSTAYNPKGSLVDSGHSMPAQEIPRELSKSAPVKSVMSRKTGIGFAVLAGIIGIVFCLIIIVLYNLLPSILSSQNNLSIPTPNVIFTSVMQTVDAQKTQESRLTPTVSPPSSVSSLTPIPPGPTSAPVCDKADFVADVTIPDGTNVSPNLAFTKTWRIKNIGTCTWTTNYAVVFSSGESMNGPVSQAFPADVDPGQMVDISVELTTPALPGHYRGMWKLRNASGDLFGVIQNPDGVFWVDIVVKEPLTPTP